MFTVQRVTHLVLFFGCFLLTFLLTYLFRRVALRLNVLAEPGGHKSHTVPKPYLGGLALLLGFFGPVLYLLGNGPLLALAGSSLLVAGVGLVDDVIDLSGSTKLVLLALAVYISTEAGMITRFFVHEPWGVVPDTLITITWALILISAFNAIDNMDGLATGLGIIACLMFYVIASVQFPQPLWARLSVGLAGALLGFLPYNFYPSVIFLGDSGSFLVGFLLAILSVMGEWSNHPVKSATIPLVILSIPVMDLVFTVFYRYLTGTTNSLLESIEYSARDHLSHRIQQVRNFGPRRTVLMVYTLGLISGLVGVVMRNTHPLESGLALTVVMLVYLMVILLLLPNLNHVFWRWQEGSHERNG